MIRRLDPIKDRGCFVEAYSWDKDYPRWYQDLEKIAHLPLDKFIDQAPERADFGLFVPDLVGMISILRRAPQVFEGHVWAKRRTPIEPLGSFGAQLRESLQGDLDMKFGYVWIAQKNLPIKKLCAMIGLRPDGAIEIDGESHGRPIVWERYSC